jgi:hypothetical protein
MAGGERRRVAPILAGPGHMANATCQSLAKSASEKKTTQNQVMAILSVFTQNFEKTFPHIYVHQLKRRGPKSLT